ncbi:HAD-IA family hydrolase [Variovorax sp. PCZ-1]|uniref:HAD family hydrolase n=1 Tax=Variovorax sp. PCZ-1 TaxID=2835533 RepID=UPI001BCED294|nr:HAD-IA family hydrolase [Variovorax sp. PCZ-1]MBS7806331.1 HAD-IA family hydrolase [Variovorax sp. PCZ-1]
MSSISTSQRHFDCITFDWDGTLFDSTAIITRCIQGAVAEVGGTVPSDKEASYVIGLGLMQALAHAAPDVPKEKYPALGEAYKRQWALHVDDISFFPGTMPMLRDLQARGKKLAVATGKSRRGLDEVLQRELDGIKLSHLFDATRTADQTAGKPDPLMLNELMQELDVKPERMLMIGDTTHDLLLARNAGVASVGVSFGAHAHADFAQYEPLFVAHSMKELHVWLLENA